MFIGFFMSCCVETCRNEEITRWYHRTSSVTYCRNEVFQRPLAPATSSLQATRTFVNRISLVGHKAGLVRGSNRFPGLVEGARMSQFGPELGHQPEKEWGSCSYHVVMLAELREEGFLNAICCCFFVSRSLYQCIYIYMNLVY